MLFTPRLRTVTVAVLACSLHALLFASAAAKAPEAIDSVSALKQRLVEHFAAESAVLDPQQVDQLLADVNERGEFSELEKEYGSERVGYRRLEHFRRIGRLSVAFHREHDATRRDRLRQTLQRTLSVWLPQPAPDAPNWHKQIGVPKTLARIALLFEDELTPEQIQQVLVILRTPVRPDGTLDYADALATGANLMDEAEVQIVAHCLTRDPEGIRRYVRMIEQEIKPGNKESIQVDWSFHQHGPLLYNGGYGAGFVRDATALASALARTDFAFSPATVSTLRQYILEGFQFMARGPSLDHLTAGRQIVRPELGGPASGLRRALEAMREADPDHAPAYRQFDDRLAGKAPAETTPVGHRVYWMSDYVTHQRRGFFASARMSSRRVQGHESGNEENERGYHLGDGAMTVMVTGNEYRNIFPLWDWHHVPGVSNVVNRTLPFPRHFWGRGAQGFSDFAGGVSDGELGVAAMELHRAGLQARKAWFFLPDSVVCLGAGLLPDDPALQVVTTVDQRWARGAVRTSGVAAALPAGPTHDLTGTRWVHHDGVTYLFPRGGPVRARVDRRSAPWSAVRSPQVGPARLATAADRRIVEGDVFMLWLDFDPGVYQRVDYAYIVAPGLAPDDLKASPASVPTILANEVDLQAIVADDTIQAVFYRPGTLALADGRQITVDQPCLLQLRAGPDGAGWHVAAGNPTHRVQALRVTLRRPGDTASPPPLLFTFSPGDWAGQPVLKTVPGW